jgi:hypothetical protein
LGNDGDTTTFWEADAGDSNAWWQVDMERIVLVRGTKLTFPTIGNWRYRIEISEDGTYWKLITDQTQSTCTNKVRTDTAQNGELGRFLRVTFTNLPVGMPAAIAEIEILGQLTSQ